MNTGDYVRTKKGKIVNIIDKKFDDTLLIDLYTTDKNYYLMEIDIIKSSPNIIDLIEVGDYVNGVLVESIYQREKDKLYIHSFDTEIMMCFTNNNIKSIVTREMFESIKYEVE